MKSMSAVFGLAVSVHFGPAGRSQDMPSFWNIWLRMRLQLLCFTYRDTNLWI